MGPREMFTWSYGHAMRQRLYTEARVTEARIFISCAWTFFLYDLERGGECIYALTIAFVYSEAVCQELSTIVTRANEPEYVSSQSYFDEFLREKIFCVNSFITKKRSQHFWLGLCNVIHEDVEHAGWSHYIIDQTTHGSDSRGSFLLKKMNWPRAAYNKFG